MQVDGPNAGGQSERGDAPPPAAAEPLTVLVEPEDNLRRFLRTYLTSRGGRCLETASLAEGTSVALAQRPAAVVLDVGARDGDPGEFTLSVHGQTGARILLLGDPDETRAVVRCLDAGADDYLTKPFTAGDLADRLELVLEPPRADPAATSVRAGPLVVDLEDRSVRVASRRVALTMREFQLLVALARRAGHVLTIQQIAHAIWGDPASRGPGEVRLLMMTLRSKLEEDPARPRLIMTETGIGYRITTRRRTADPPAGPPPCARREPP